MIDHLLQHPARVWRVWLVVGIATTVLLLDQVSKQMVLSALGPGGERRAVEVIPSLLRFIYVENTGAAFGIFQGHSDLLTVLALAVVAFLVYYFRQAITRSTWLAAALGLQFGGAFGNIVDRVRHGFVIDFIDVPHWPTFNVADSAITVGVIVLGIVLLRSGQEASPEPQAGDHAPAPADGRTVSGAED